MSALHQLQELLRAKGLPVQTGEAMLPRGISTLSTQTADLATQLELPEHPIKSYGQTKILTDLSAQARRETGPRPASPTNPAPNASPPARLSPVELPPGVHEFVLSPGQSDPPTEAWHPPMILLAVAMARAQLQKPHFYAENAGRPPQNHPLPGEKGGLAWGILEDSGGFWGKPPDFAPLRRTVFWIGRRCWPTLTLLHATQGPRPDTLRRNILLDPLTDADRVWATEQILRAGMPVVADGFALRPAESRRLQIAAEAGKAVGLLARAPSEAIGGSFALARWEVVPLPSETFEPRWSVELIRATGALSRLAPEEKQEGLRETVAGSRWTLEWISEVGRGTGHMRVSPMVGRGTGDRRRPESVPPNPAARPAAVETPLRRTA